MVIHKATSLAPFFLPFVFLDEYREGKKNEIYGLSFMPHDVTTTINRTREFSHLVPSRRNSHKQGESHEKVFLRGARKKGGKEFNEPVFSFCVSFVSFLFLLFVGQKNIIIATADNKNNKQCDSLKIEAARYCDE